MPLAQTVDISSTAALAGSGAVRRAFDLQEAGAARHVSLVDVLEME